MRVCMQVEDAELTHCDRLLSSWRISHELLRISKTTNQRTTDMFIPMFIPQT